MRRTAAALLIGLAALAACASRQRAPLLPPLGDQGEVWLYALPFPREADRLAFTLSAVSAEREDGAAAPLTLVAVDLEGARLHHQRLLAWGRLEPGRYRGLLVTASRASLATPEGRQALLPGAEPTHVDLPFLVRARRAEVVSLSLRWDQAVHKAFAFAPSFSGSIAPRTAPQAVGLCTSTASDDVTIFDRRSKLVTGVVPTGRAPRGLALDASAARAYVALSGEDQIDVIDVAAGESVGRIRLAGGDRPRDLALAGPRLLVVLNPGTRTAAFVDPVALVELSRVPVGDEPTSLVVDRAGARAYVFNRRSSTISVLDLANRSVAATLPTDAEPLRGQLDRAGTRLWVIHAGSSSMTALSLPGLGTASRIHVGLGAVALRVDARSDLVYVGHAGEARIQAYGDFSSLPVDEFDVPDPPAYATIDDAENTLVVLSRPARSISFVDLTGRKTVGRLEVGFEPFALVLQGERP